MNRLKPGKRNIAIYVSVVTVILILLIANFYAMYSNTWKNLVDTRQTLVSKEAEEVNNLLTESFDSVRIAAYEIGIMQEEGQSNDEILKYLERHTEVYEKAVDHSYEGLYGVFDGEYLDGIGWEPEPGYVPENRPWYTTALKADGKVVMVRPYVDSMTNTIRMSISALLADKKSVVALDVTMDAIQSLVEDNTVKNGWRYMMILDDEGNVVAHSDEEEIGKAYSDDNNKLGNEIFSKMKSDDVFEVKYDRQTFIAFAGNIENDMHIVSLIEKGEMRLLLNRIVILFVLTLLLVFGIIFVLFRILKKGKVETVNLEHQINAISQIYVSMYIFNIKNDTFRVISNSIDGYKQAFEINAENANAQYLLRKVMDNITNDRFKRSMYEFIELSTLEERIKEKKLLTKEFMNYKNVKCLARFVPVEWDENGDLESVMWMVEITDERNDGAK